MMNHMIITECVVDHPLWIVIILCQSVSSPWEYPHGRIVMGHLIAILCDDIARIVTSRKFTYRAILMYFHILSLWLKRLNNHHIQDMYIMFEFVACCPRVSLMLIIFFNYVNRAEELYISHLQMAIHEFLNGPHSSFYTEIALCYNRQYSDHHYSTLLWVRVHTGSSRYCSWYQVFTHLPHRQVSHRTYVFIVHRSPVGETGNTIFSAFSCNCCSWCAVIPWCLCLTSVVFMPHQCCVYASPVRLSRFGSGKHVGHYPLLIILLPETL